MDFNKYSAVARQRAREYAMEAVSNGGMMWFPAMNWTTEIKEQIIGALRDIFGYDMIQDKKEELFIFLPLSANEERADKLLQQAREEKKKMENGERRQKHGPVPVVQVVSDR